MQILTRKLPGDYGQVWISEAVTLSKPDNVRNVTRLFERQTTATRRKNAYKGHSTMRVRKFVDGLLTSGKVVG